jgi:hypothetical protein
MIAAISGALSAGIALALGAFVPDLNPIVGPALFGVGLGLVTWSLTAQLTSRATGAHSSGSAETEAGH